MLLKCKIQHFTLKQGVLITSCVRHKSSEQQICLQDRMTTPAVPQRLQTSVSNIQYVKEFQRSIPMIWKKRGAKSASFHSLKQTVEISAKCRISITLLAETANTKVVKTKALFTFNGGNGSLRRLQSAPQAANVPVQVIQVTLLWASATCDFLILTNAWLPRGYLLCGCIHRAAMLLSLRGCSDSSQQTLGMQRRITFLIGKCDVFLLMALATLES